MIILSMIGGWIGGQAWGQAADTASLLWLLCLPVAFGLAPSRWSAGALLLSYYMAGARGLPGGSAVFFGDSAPWWYGWALWAGACLLLSLPYVVLWTEKTSERGWRFLLAVILVTVPPVGLIGWCSPFAAGGVLFPGMGWSGLLLFGGMLSILPVVNCFPRRAWAAFALVGVLSIGCNWAWNEPVEPRSWHGMDTAFPRLSSGGDDDAGQLLAAMARVQWVKALAMTVPANWVLVLPETLLGPFGGMAEFELAEAEDMLTARGSRILVGAELMQPDGRFVNGLLMLGAGAVNETGRMIVKQSIPVPVAMWTPWLNEGAVADLWGRDSVIEIGNVRVAGLICYEQLLPWSILLRMTKQPSVLITASNVWWARNTSIPAIQKETVAAFGRLFGVPVIKAVNL